MMWLAAAAATATRMTAAAAWLAAAATTAAAWFAAATAAAAAWFTAAAGTAAAAWFAAAAGTAGRTWNIRISRASQDINSRKDVSNSITGQSVQGNIKIAQDSEILVISKIHILDRILCKTKSLKVNPLIEVIRECLKSILIKITVHDKEA